MEGSSEGVNSNPYYDFLMDENEEQIPRKSRQVSAQDQIKVVKWILFGPFWVIKALLVRIPKEKRKIVIGSIVGIFVLLSVIGSVVSPSETGMTSSSTSLSDKPMVTTSVETSLLNVSLSEFKNYVDTNFGSTTWISFVTDISNNNGALWIETSLFKDQDAFEPGKSLCVAASMFIFSDDVQRFDSLSIRYSSGERMVLRTNLLNNANSSTCDPEL
jgi:hypothetical protein